MADDTHGPGDVDLTPAERADIDGMYLRLGSGTYYELLSVPTNAERKVIRDAYFGLSQRFHPDVFFGRKLGPWKATVEEIFREATRAYDVLGNKRQRADYDAQNGITAQPAAPAVSVRPAVTTPAPPRVDTTPPMRTSTSQPAPVSVSSQPPRTTTSSPPRTASSRQMPAVPTFDPEATRKAAREALARKMGLASGNMPRSNSGSLPRSQTASYGSPAPSATAPTDRPGADGDPNARTATMPMMGSVHTRPRADGSISPLASLHASHTARIEAERSARVGRLVQVADEAEARNDLMGASNALTVARSVAPDDMALAARADELARRVAVMMVEKNTEQARTHERAGRFDQAAPYWERAALGRPSDAGLLLHAARAYVRAERELPKAAELARRATTLAPRSPEAHLVLAQVFQAGGLKASAISAAEAALKLDPTSLLVKDLLRQLKA